MKTTAHSFDCANPLALISVLACSIPLISRADQVIPDDLIVQSSLAVGIDASDGESFNFDTMRLKENNLRFHFDDTSSTSGFAANDWRLIANDTGSGGANFFAIEDSTAGIVPFRVDAGASAESLRIASSSRIGLGTSDPGLHMEMKKSDTPGIRLSQDNTAGFTAQTWDVGGNEANFFIRDITGGSKLCFRIRPGAPTSSIDIAASGNVGIGTASPTAKLHVAGNALVTGTLEIGSSRTLKEDIRDLSMEEAREAFAELRPVHYKYRTDSEQQLGFIAEDVPELVATNSRKSLVPMDFVAVLTKVVQQHDSRVRELEKKLSARDEAIEALTVRLNALEQGTRLHAVNPPESDEIRAARRAESRDTVDSNATVPVAASLPHLATTAEVIDNGR